MLPHTEAVRSILFSRSAQSARELAQNIGVSQPTVSRVLAGLGDDVVRIGGGRSIQYALRDSIRGLSEIPVYRVDAAGRIERLGVLVPVRTEGFVIRQEDGGTHYSEGFPWWLFDMRPQGYLGRMYAARHGAELGLPARVSDWTDTHALRALLAHGDDVVGNLLLGERARERFVAMSLPAPIAQERKAQEYVRLAREAAQGEVPGSSAGGEQPKFTAYVETPDGPQHVIVKFSEREPGPVSERWRDLLLAEHLALETLRDAGLPAAGTRVVDGEGQRFLEVERFDRVGGLGRCALFSLSALDAEFVGLGTGGWPAIVRSLAAQGHVRAQAVAGAELLWAFGALIGNTDMHGGNLSFVAEQGRPYGIAPAYDMTPMAFAPRSGGGLPDALAEAVIDAGVSNASWRRALGMAQAFVGRVSAASGFSRRFSPCIAALVRHLDVAHARIGRLR